MQYVKYTLSAKSFQMIAHSSDLFGTDLLAFCMQQHVFNRLKC